MPYGITVGALTIVFILIELVLIAQRRLLPGLVIFGASILLVLFITGLIETAIQVFGPSANVNGNCQTYITNEPSKGLSVETLAWLEQSSAFVP